MTISSLVFSLKAVIKFIKSSKLSKGSNPPITIEEVIGFEIYFLTISSVSISIMLVYISSLFWQHCFPQSFSHLKEQKGKAINIDGFL